MQVRTAALFAGLALAAGWGLGGRFGTGPAVGTGGRPSSGPRPLGVEQPMPSGPFTDRLRLRLEQLPRAPRTSRNPFTFGPARATRPGSEHPAPDVVPTDPPPATTPAAPLAPAFALTGIASNGQGDAIEHTAIVTDGTSLYFVTGGDELPGGLTVVDVQETAVVLRDASGAERTLRLR